MLSYHVKKTIAVYDAIADDYAKKLDDYAPRPEQEKFVSLLPKHIKVLDAGCGPGRDCDYFVKQGLQVVGVDLSEKLLVLAKERVPQAKFIKQDLRKLRFSDQSFDGIWACASLHHLKRDEVPLVLQKFFQLLTSHGILFILVKEGKGEVDIVESLSSGLPRHFVYYTLEELNTLLKEAGFSIIETYTWREEVRRSGRSDLVWISSFSRKPL